MAPSPVPLLRWYRSPEDLVRWLDREGLDCYAELIWGAPGETVDSFMSGYDRALIDQTTLERTASFLPKPFSPRTLLARVAELIGGQEKRISA